MLRKEIQYKDLEGNNVRGEFYFHLSTVELIEMETEVEGGLKVRMQRMIDGQDQTKVMSTLRSIVARAVGEKASDGRRFLKERENKSPFLDSNAYSAFVIELLTDTKSAIDFFNGVVPNDLAETAAEAGVGPSQEELAKTAASLNFPGLSAEDNKALAATPVPTSTVTPVPESPLNAAAFGHTDDRDYTDWRTYTKDELLAMDNDMFEAVGGKVRPGMDKILMGIAFQRRARQGGA